MSQERSPDGPPAPDQPGAGQPAPADPRAGEPTTGDVGVPPRSPQPGDSDAAGGSQRPSSPGTRDAAADDDASAELYPAELRDGPAAPGASAEDEAELDEAGAPQKSDASPSAS